MIGVSGVGASLGLDVGKGEHHAIAATPAGKKAFDTQLPNSEPKLRKVFGLCLARRRADVLFAMLRGDTSYDPQPAPST